MRYEHPDIMRAIYKALFLAAIIVLAGCTSGSNTSFSGAQRSADMGLAAGGANDVNNFQDNVEEGYLPATTDLTAEGLYYDYYFDTGSRGECSDLFCPTYSTAVTEDPLSNGTERYLSVGVASNIEQEEFERKKLNLVVVLDVSGSMNERFDRYYYDEGDEREAEASEQKPKIDAATEAIADLTRHLNPDDRLGVVVYNENSQVVLDLQSVSEMDMDAVREQIREIDADGGTNMESGMDEATRMLEPHRNANADEYENRVIYLTDAMPNTGDTSLEGFRGTLEGQAADGIYSTFVGVGVDFNTQLVDAISNVRGANYYAVHTNEQFRERMDEGFEHMVTPLVFDLSLQVESDGYEIEKVYGSPNTDESTGEVMYVSTLFPSKTTENGTKGGVILLQLDRIAPDSQLTLTATYEDRQGETHESTVDVSFEEREPNTYDTTAIRKAVLLSQYVDLMQNWIGYEQATLTDKDPETPDDGIEPVETRDLGTWERQSTDLRVSDTYQERIAQFGQHFEREMTAIGDGSLEQELEIIQTVASYEGNKSAS